jgi:hypothetical protein
MDDGDCGRRFCTSLRSSLAGACSRYAGESDEGSKSGHRAPIIPARHVTGGASESGLGSDSLMPDVPAVDGWPHVEPAAAQGLSLPNDEE